MRFDLRTPHLLSVMIQIVGHHLRTDVCVITYITTTCNDRVIAQGDSIPYTIEAAGFYTTVDIAIFTYDSLFA